MAKLIKLKGKPRARRLVIFGNPKTGKTFLCGQLAKKFNLLWIDTENGIDTLLNSKELGLTDEDLSRIEYIHIPDTTSNPIAIDTIARLFSSHGTHYICDDHGQFDCAKCITNKDQFFPINLDELTPENNWVIIIDSGSQLSSSALNRVINNSSVDVSTLSSKESKVSYTLWAGQGALLDRILSEVENRNVNVVITAHEQETAGDDKVKKLCPSIGTSNFSSRVAKYFSNVIHTKQQNRKFVVESANGSSINADCGGHLNIDLSQPGVTLCDFFQPVSSAEASNVVENVTTAAPQIGKSSQANAITDKLAALRKS